MINESDPFSLRVTWVYGGLARGLKAVVVENRAGKSYGTCNNNELHVQLMKEIFTIGYEGASLSGLVGTLLHMQIEHVADIREIAQSRRPGFSKNALAHALAVAGIGYSHCKPLGDPKAGREAARRGDFDQFQVIFEEHMDTPAARDALTGLAQTAGTTTTVLLCYERDPKQCHRSLVANHLIRIESFNIKHIGVVEHLGKRASIASEPTEGDPRAN
jgi:uncharacterized protein (DUF488 family)